MCFKTAPDESVRIWVEDYIKTNTAEACGVNDINIGSGRDSSQAFGMCRSKKITTV